MFRTALPVAIACVLASPARAAGGHHSVDDAAILDAGRCQVESWFERAQDVSARLWHLGSACRAGPFQVGVNLDAIHGAAEGAIDVAAIQVKWARPLSEQVAIGVVVATAWQDRAPHAVGSSIVIPLTWQPSDALRVHVNAGREFIHAAPDANRGGIAVEWAASPGWSLVAERFRELHADRWRAGARRSFGNSVSVDLSRAQGLGSAPTSWTLGVNWIFDR